MIYIFPPEAVSVSSYSDGTHLSIPKIKASASIKEQVDPFNKSEYQEVLKKSIAHAKGTSLPGENGTSFIFAHSSGNPWELTRINTVFLRLSELQKGDQIIIHRNKKKYTYVVREKKEVLPSEISYLLSTKRTQLILQTCTPIGTDWKRLLVFADPM